MIGLRLKGIFSILSFLNNCEILDKAKRTIRKRQFFSTDVLLLPTFSRIDDFSAYSPRKRPALLSTRQTTFLVSTRIAASTTDYESSIFTAVSIACLVFPYISTECASPFVFSDIKLPDLCEASEILAFLIFSSRTSRSCWAFSLIC